MSNEPTVKATSAEDIDLLALIERCILFFRKYKWVYITAILLGIGSGLYFYTAIPTSYRSRMIVHSFFLTNQEELQIVNNWNQLLAKKEYSDLATILHCSPAMLHAVKKMKAQEIQQLASTINPNGFTVDVIVTDNNILDSLQSAIVNGFEHGEYLGERLRVKRANLQELIGRTESEIQKLDSNKKIFDGIMTGTGRASSSLILDASSVNRQMIEMTEKLMGYKENLQFTAAVQVLQGFSRFDQPDGPHLIPWLIIGLAVFLSLAYAVTLFHSILHKMKARQGMGHK